MMMAGQSKKSRQSGAGLAGLAARLTKRLANENPGRNLVFSPLSIYAAVALLAPGARGETLDEVLRLLGARSRDELAESISTMLGDALKDRSDSSGPSVAFACGMWNDKTRPLKPAYREAVVGTYRAEQINAWVAGVTRNLINDVVGPQDLRGDDLVGKTDVVLANAIYFKGKWDLPFYKRDTMDRPFHRLDGAAVDAPFMDNSSRHFIAVHDGFKVLKLQYKMQQQQDHGRTANYPWAANFKKGTQYSMCIFLPDERDGLRTLLDEITSRPSFVQEHLPWSQVRVGDFGVPKFKLEFTSNVTEILKGLGLRLPFDTAAADMCDMVEPSPDSLPFSVKDVFHKAVIEVNEQGTEAAAVTMMMAGGPGCAMVPPAVDFVADHPFAYFIVEEASGTILFAGHVVDPTNGEGMVRTGQPAAATDRGSYKLPPMVRIPPMYFDQVRPMRNTSSTTGLATLAAGLAKCLAEGTADSNMIFSPLSIYAALALVAAGARGATLDEIVRVLGAQSRGELEELVSRTADALKDRSESGGTSVAFACGVWSDLTRPLKPAFRQAVVGTYKAAASVVDFRHASEESRSQINAWAAHATKNLIDSILPPGSIKPATTRVVLGNVVYFKGVWEDHPFDRRETEHKPFHRLDGCHVNVPFMQSRRKQFVAVHDGFKVLKLRYKMAEGDQDCATSMTPVALYVNPRPSVRAYSLFPVPQLPRPPYGFYRTPPRPYGQFGPQGYPCPRPRVAAPVNHMNAFVPHSYAPEQQTSRYAAPSQSVADKAQFSMCIFLPDAHDGLRGLVDTIASRPRFLHDHLPEWRVDVHEIRVPKFKLSFYSSVVAVLKKLGIELPFCERADLSDMVEDDGSGIPIMVDEVIHRAVIEVNEEGTEAAALTMGISPEAFECRRSPPPPQLDFVADHPFAFYIVEETTGAVVFGGHVLDPSKEE